MAFEPGKSGNPNGRPSKERMAAKNLDKKELEALLRKCSKASPRALQLIIDAMDNDQLPLKDRLKYASEVFGMHMTSLRAQNMLDNAGAKSEQSSGADGEEQVDAKPAVVFNLVKK